MSSKVIGLSFVIYNYSFNYF